MNLYSTHAALLSNVVLTPIYLQLLGLNVASWGFKLMGSFIFSFIPVVLYFAFKRVTNNDNAFFSSFLLISLFWYYNYLPISIRNGYAMLFLSFLLLMLVSSDIKRVHRSTLSIVFALSLVTSHYGLSYIFMIILIVGFIFFLILEGIGYKVRDRVFFSLNFTVLYLTMALSWYIYVAESANFNWILRFAKDVLTSIEGFLAPESSNVIYSMTARQLSFSIDVTKYILLIFFILIAIGIFLSIYKNLFRKENSFSEEYLFISLGFLGICGITLLPVGKMGTIRVIFIGLLVFSPMALIGFRYILRLFNRNISGKSVTCFFSVLLFFFFAFNSGLISETVTRGDDYPPNALIAKERIERNDNIYAKEYLYRERYAPYQTIQQRTWILAHGEDSIERRCDYIMQHSIYRIVRVIYLTKNEKLPGGYFKPLETSKNTGYVLLGYHNIKSKLFFKANITESFSINRIQEEGMSKIYTNSGSIIYYR